MSHASSEFRCLDGAQFTIKQNADSPHSLLCQEPVHFPKQMGNGYRKSLKEGQRAETAKTDEQIVKQCLEGFSNSKTNPSASYTQVHVQILS